MPDLHGALSDLFGLHDPDCTRYTSEMLRQALLKTIEKLPMRFRLWVKANPLLGPLGAKALRSVVSNRKPVIVTVQAGPNRGLKLAIDAATPRYYWLEGHDEPEVITVLQQLSPPGGTVIDIGAHVGIETLMLSRWVGDAGAVISVEADPATMQRLNNNIQINHLQNIRTVQKAISDHEGEVQFSADALVTSSIVSGNQTTGGITVPCVTLDGLVDDCALQRIDLIKIDVEDHEVAVLRGAQNVLRVHKPALLIEIHSPESRDGCSQILRDLGYDLRAVEQGGIDAMQPPEGSVFQRFHLLGKCV